MLQSRTMAPHCNCSEENANLRKKVNGLERIVSSLQAEVGNLAVGILHLQYGQGNLPSMPIQEREQQSVTRNIRDSEEPLRSQEMMQIWQSIARARGRSPISDARERSISSEESFVGGADNTAFTEMEFNNRSSGRYVSMELPERNRRDIVESSMGWDGGMKDVDYMERMGLPEVAEEYQVNGKGSSGRSGMVLGRIENEAERESRLMNEADAWGNPDRYKNGPLGPDEKCNICYSTWHKIEEHSKAMHYRDKKMFAGLGLKPPKRKKKRGGFMGAGKVGGGPGGDRFVGVDHRLMGSLDEEFVMRQNAREFDKPREWKKRSRDRR